MEFNFDKCRDVLHRALIEALIENGERLREVHQTEEVWALSYDLLLWNPYVGMLFG